MWRLFFVALLTATLPAQTVRLANLSAVPFDGWVRCTVDQMPPHRVGIVTTPNGTTCTYMLGRPTGLDTRAIDVRVRLEAGERLALDLTKSLAFDGTRAPIPGGPAAYLGGDCTLAGATLYLRSIVADGAGYLGHVAGRVGKMLNADVWVHWAPEEPWARGELVVTCSNPSVPDLGERIGREFRLTFGDALVLTPGKRHNGIVLDEGTYLADGQARAIQLTLFWARHVRHAQDWASVGAIHRVSAVGLTKLRHEGNPILPPGLDVVAWAAARIDESERRLHTFEAALLGPNPRSGDTGQQADQTFVAGEAMVAPDAARVVYLNALRVSNRPCHHLEADGSQLNIDTHPQLALWDSRPHIPHFPDSLGKPIDRGLSLGETSGWSGSDVEHWFHNNTVAAARLSGSPACQWLLSMQARVYRYQQTTGAQYGYHSTPFAGRAQGYEGIMAVHLWRDLEDRELATRVRAHWLDRAEQVLAPHLAQEQDGLDWHLDILGPGWRASVWQESVKCYGHDIAGQVFGHERMRKLALRTAKSLVERGWIESGGKWWARDDITKDGSPAMKVGSYQWFGSPLAVAVVLRHDPKHEPARSIWRSLLANANDAGQMLWLAPGIK